MLMKLLGTIWSVGVSLALICGASAQGFVNLDFESATLVPVGGGQVVRFAQAFPAWTETIAGALDTNALYDSMYLDSAGISIIDIKASLLAGAVIDGFIPLSFNPPWAIPQTAQSLLTPPFPKPVWFLLARN